MKTKQRIQIGTVIVSLKCEFTETELMGDNPDGFLAEILESAALTLGEDTPVTVEIIKPRVVTAA